MKAVLVIDMPDICAMCPMCVSGFDEEGEEGLECTITNIETYGKRPSWCPLRPLPKHKYGFEDDGLSPSDQILIQSGWNDCLDAITGETE